MRVNVSQECELSMKTFADSLRNFDQIAVKQLDSWGRIPSGLMSGGWIDHGGYDECLSLDSSQYCLLMAKMPLPPEAKIEGYGRPYDPRHFNFSTRVFQTFQTYVHFFRYMNITSALCLPKGCSSQELTELASKASQYFETGLEMTVELCQNRYEANPITVGQAVSLIVIAIMIAINVGSVFLAKRGSFWYHFNFAVNWRSLFRANKTPSQLDYLNGIKAITMAGLIFIHLAFTILPTNFKTAFTMFGLTRGHSINVFSIGGYITDTFFLVTGLEATWALLTARGLKFRLGPYLILRWLRFVPSIAWIICWRILIFSPHARNLIGGPLWGHKRAAGGISASCETNWIYHLIFIAHFFDTADDFAYCILSDWYLESDYLYHLAFILVILTVLRQKRSLAVLYSVSLVMAGSIATGAIMHFKDTHHSWLTTTFPNRAFFKYLTVIHGKPWSHVSSYFMGVLCAFVLVHVKPKISRLILTAAWSIWIVLWAILFAYDFVINLRSEPIGNGISLLFGSTCKVLWSFIMSWFIYTLHNGLIMESVRRFFSWHVFTVLSRINLSVLLVNLMLMMVRNATYQTPTYMVMGEKIFSLAIPMYFCVYTVSLVFAVLVESPTRNIIKWLIGSSLQREEANRQRSKEEMVPFNTNNNNNA